jgi:hypothetical protein
MADEANAQKNLVKLKNEKIAEHLLLNEQLLSVVIINLHF